MKMRLMIPAALAAVVLLSGCVGKKNTTPVAPESGFFSHSRLVVSTSDFTAGEVRVIGKTVESAKISVFNDNAVRLINGTVFLLEKFGASTVMTLDIAGAGSVLSQVSLGAINLNPYDLVAAGPGKYYVSLQNGPSLLAGPASGPFAAAIDLTVYSNPGNPDHFPHMDHMVAAGGKVYLLIQRGKPKSTGWGLDFDSCGLVLVINPANDSVEKAIRLKANNPASIATADASTLFVINQGDPYVSGDGDIERIDLANDSVTVTTNESAFGADVIALSELTQRDGTNFYVSLSYAWTGSSGHGQAWLINAQTGTVLYKLAPLSDAWGGLAYSKVDNKVCVGDRGAGDEGVKIFDGTTGALISGPIGLGLPPYSMKVLE